MAAVELPQNSMFTNTPVYSLNDTLVFGLRRPTIIPDATDRFLEITASTAGRLDKIAASFYGSEQLWWVIADVNFMIDPQSEVNIGDKIRVPSPARVQQALL